MNGNGQERMSCDIAILAPVPSCRGRVEMSHREADGGCLGPDPPR